MQIQEFLKVCEEITFPVALKKTFWGTTRLTFLGLLLDTIQQIICIPLDKIEKALDWIEYFLQRKKATVLDFQKLCGILNFLCRCIVPGRAFVRRLYIDTKNLKPHHHVKVTKENKPDLMIWKGFLSKSESFSRPFMETVSLNAMEVDMFSDASRNFNLGFGAYCGPEWCWGRWDKLFCDVAQPSIEYLELYAVLVGALNWIKFFSNRRIILFCDNEAVVHMINNSSSKCKNCMVLIRLLVAECLVSNVRVFAKSVSTKDNGKADALSRLDYNRFLRLSGGHMNPTPTDIPSPIWPLDKIWLN